MMRLERETAVGRSHVESLPQSSGGLLSTDRMGCVQKASSRYQTRTLLIHSVRVCVIDLKINLVLQIKCLSELLSRILASYPVIKSSRIRE